METKNGIKTSKITECELTDNKLGVFVALFCFDFSIFKMFYDKMCMQMDHRSPWPGWRQNGKGKRSGWWEDGGLR